MKKFLAAVAFVALVAAAACPVVTQAAGNFSDWKCSQCGQTRHMAGQNQPPVNGCKASGDGKHIWFRN